MNNKLSLLDELKELELKREKIEYLLKQVKNSYIEEIEIQTRIATKNFNFEGDRKFIVDERLFIDYLNQEVIKCSTKYIDLLNKLKEL